MPDVIFDRQDQLDKIATGLMPGETIIAVYDAKGAGTGFVGITNKRVILQDNSFVGGKIAVTSILYKNINAVSFLSDKSMFGKIASSSEIHMRSGGKDYTAEFREPAKAKHIHDVILWGQSQ